MIFRFFGEESQTSWEGFLCHLYRRELISEGLELIVTDGGKELLAALPLVYPGVRVQRYWAHKARDVLSSVRKADWEALKADLHTISHASGLGQAQGALGCFCARWMHLYPKDEGWRIYYRGQQIAQHRSTQLRKSLRTMRRSKSRARAASHYSWVYRASASPY